MDAVSQVVKKLGPIKLAMMAMVFFSTIGFFMYLTNKASAPEMALLVSGVDPAEGARIMGHLESQGVLVEARGDGTQILAPKDKISRLRMELAQEGMASGGVVGNEIFDHTGVFGLSSTLVNINQIRALEGELTKSIKTIQGVQQARVHLVMPKRELFTQQRPEATASILLKMRSSLRLKPEQVQAIQNLVASAVPNLAPEKISIIDDKGTLLARLHSPDDATESYGSSEEKRVGYEKKLSQMIESLVERSVGIGKVRAEVTADMDFDRITLNSVEYDPNGQVLRNSSTTEEDTKNSEDVGGSAVSVQNALEGQGGGNGPKNSSSGKRSEENMSYEISSTTKNHVKEVGTIKKLSVAVLVDGVYQQAADGKETYAPRTKEELDQLTNLIKTAIGFDDKRGDKLEVVNMKFTPIVVEETDPKASEKSWFEKIDMTRAVELIVLALVGLLILLLVIRPMVMKMLEQNQKEALGSDLGASGLSNASLESSKMATSLPGQSPQTQDEMVNIANVEGMIRSETVKKVGDIIEQNPEEAVTIIRNWMYAPNS
ncbi:MAG TPA: flagellar basal-body MS-ring/collar protein FliF [Alphaproteobacteria bacterium]|nr:flagellar basal-body MS-ring/collar protein FliF [Alphaproteobacteria bacterium]